MVAYQPKAFWLTNYQPIYVEVWKCGGRLEKAPFHSLAAKSTYYVLNTGDAFGCASGGYSIN